MRMRTLVPLCGALGFGAFYLLVVRPRAARWGATGEEASRLLPGDGVVRGRLYMATRVITIDAQPEDVWPWIVQMGSGRGGWYALDRLDIREREHQRIACWGCIVNKDQLVALLAGVREGTVPLETAADQLARLPHEDLGFASIDHHRTLRRGHCETIFCAGKTTEQVVAIAERMVAFGHENILATRARGETLDAPEKAVPVRIDRTASLAVVNPVERPGAGLVFVVAAGTSDIPVAEEAALTAECSGSFVERVYDVGVAGIHRLLAAVDRLSKANVIVAVAGMEGALPTVVAGLVGCPVLAVPTSVGYGASFGGLAALLTMLNSCAPGISVLNIDNGFGAGYSANVINLMATRAEVRAGSQDGEPAGSATLRVASGPQP